VKASDESGSKGDEPGSWGRAKQKGLEIRKGLERTAIKTGRSKQIKRS
jgi:hypothetical protein